MALACCTLPVPRGGACVCACLRLRVLTMLLRVLTMLERVLIMLERVLVMLQVVNRMNYRTRAVARLCDALEDALG